MTKFAAFKIIPIDGIKPYEKNAKIHSPEQVAQIVASFIEYGYTNPILIDDRNNLIAGHGRLEAAKVIGMTEIPAMIVSDLTPAKRRKLILADNKIAENASWDEALLKAELAELKEIGEDIDDIGFSTDELEDFFPNPKSGKTDDDEIPEIVSPVTVASDIWLLGNHRVMCGNSRDRADVKKLINGLKVDIVAADPPYGIDEKTDRVEHVKTFKNQGVAAKGQYEKIIGDDSIETALDVFNISCEIAPVVVYWGGNYFAHQLPATPCWGVWDKRVEENQRDLNSDCELAYVKHPHKKSVRIFRHLWKGMIKASENSEARVHPTQKPVALAEWSINEYAPDAKVVVDLFGGSGFTLIACENLKRIGLLMEMSPNYVDVIVNRWQNFTGKEATLEATGATYAETMAQRSSTTKEQRNAQS